MNSNARFVCTRRRQSILSRHTVAHQRLIPARLEEGYAYYKLDKFEGKEPFLLEIIGLCLIRRIKEKVE